jgi:hypothetical protein
LTTRGITTCDTFASWRESPGYLPMIEFEVNQNSGEKNIADQVIMPFDAKYYF